MAPSPNDFSLLTLWRVLSVRRRTVALLAATGFLLALLFCLATTPKYTAQSRIEISASDTAALDVSPEPLASAERDIAMLLATEANVLQSDTLALQVSGQLDLENVEKRRVRFQFLRSSTEEGLAIDQAPRRRAAILKRFHRNLSVRVVGGTRMLQVEYRDPDPAIAAAVVNTLVNDYIDQRFQTRYSATRQASDWLTKQLADLKSDAETSQQRLADYQRQTGILGESETRNVIMAKLEEINKELTAAEANRIVKQAVWQLAKTGDPELISAAAGTPFAPGSPAPSPQLGLLPALRAQEAQLKADIAQTSARVGPAFPKLVEMRSQLAELQSSMSVEATRIAGRAENDYIAARNAEDMERAQFEKQKQEANKLNDSSVQYGILKREADTNRTLYEDMLGKLKQAGVLAGLRSSNIVVVDPARPPAKPSTPDYFLSLALGLAAGMIAGCGYALLLDSSDTILRSPQDMRRRTALHPIAVLPLCDGSASLKQTRAERLRALQTSLLLAAPECPPKIIVVTSALPCEGKSTVSLEFARTLAADGARVLLVDADLRRPALHQRLGLEPQSFEQYLDPDTSPSFLESTGGFFVLASGPNPNVAASLTGSEHLRTALRKWRAEFDFVVVDTPPLLSFTDGLLLARSADAILLLARAGMTTADAVLRAKELLEQARPSLLGIVLNAMNFNAPEYHHHFGHRYQPYPAEQPIV